MICSGLYLNPAFVRHHTLAFAPSSGVVYAFGGNSHGQLGIGQLSTDKSPYPVKSNFLSGNIHGTGMQKIVPVRSDSRRYSLEMLNYFPACMGQSGKYSTAVSEWYNHVTS